jgi:uncharacterized protein YjbJ (UPF0337 family)
MGYKMANFNKKKTNMNADILKGQWKEIKGEVKQKWGKLTDDDLTQIEGKEEQILGLLQKRYGYAKEKAEEEYKGFIGRYGEPPLGVKIREDREAESQKWSLFRIKSSKNGPVTDQKGFSDSNVDHCDGIGWVSRSFREPGPLRTGPRTSRTVSSRLS